MKKIALILSLIVVAPLVALTTVPPNRDAAAFSWEATTFDFGKIKQNTPVSHVFKFTNSGTTPLVISTVQASCGCTVTDYSREPIRPGAEGYVKATYDAAKPGAFSKTVVVNANAEEGYVKLTIRGEVVNQ